MIVKVHCILCGGILEKGRENMECLMCGAEYPDVLVSETKTEGENEVIEMSISMDCLISKPKFEKPLAAEIVVLEEPLTA